jgi:hypothetical protein
MLKIRHAITASKNAFLAYVDEILPQKKERTRKPDVLLSLFR